MGTTALQITRIPAGTVAAGNTVIFDTTVYAAGNISYNDTNGVLTLLAPGRYIINWWVALQSSTSTNGAVFTLVSSQGDFLTGNSSVKTGQVYGDGIIDVTTAPVTVSLRNDSTGAFFFGTQIPLKASLVVVEDAAPATTMNCFAVQQMTNFLAQMITAYAAATWTVYSKSLASFSGMPFDLYTSPNTTAPGLLRLVDSNTDYEAIPISQITAIYPGDGTVYDPSFSFLPAPDPLPQGCDSDILAAIQSYLPLGTEVTLTMGTAVTASGGVYRNELGLLILSDEMGNTPIPVFTPNLLRIFTTEDPASLPITTAKGAGKNKPTITITKE